MDSMRRRMLLTVGSAGVIGGLAGCLEQLRGVQPELTDEPTPTLEPTATPAATETMADYTVSVSEHDEHGEILVDSEGMTLYLFTNDESGKSNCYDSCAENWPPLTVDGSPSAESELPGTLGTTVRKEGTKQVTYNEWPLYYWVQDSEPGDATGQGVGDVWFVVAPDEEPPEESMESMQSTESTETDDGYDY